MIFDQKLQMQAVLSKVPPIDEIFLPDFTKFTGFRMETSFCEQDEYSAVNDSQRRRSGI